MNESGVSRPIRARAGSERATAKVEVRFARAGERRLVYVANFNSSPVGLHLEAASGGIGSVLELREAKTTRGNQVTVPGRQTNLYELFE